MLTETENPVVRRALENQARVANLGSCGYPIDWDTEFPESKSLIRHYSDLYRGEDLNYIYDQFFNAIPEICSDEIYDLTPGSSIQLTIKSVDKKGVIFEQGSIKETIICNTNLYQYPRFRDFIPTKPIACKIISRTQNTITVDPFAEMLDNWLRDHTTNFKDQYHMTEDRSVEVQDLRLIRGGFMGRVRIDSISDFCGKDVFFEAFIPGSQIVLNIEYDFDKWVGRSVKTFIINYSTKPRSTDKVLMCSAKEYLRHQGNKLMIEWFKMWCDNGEAWKALSETKMEGVITGTTHTANKCGAFVELPDQHITSMIPCKPDMLCTYKRGSHVMVSVESFEEPMKWNGIQYEHLAPYEIENDILNRISIRLTLKESRE